MADNKFELVLAVDANKANASIESINIGLSGMKDAAKRAATGASQRIDGFTGFTANIAKGAAAASSAGRIELGVSRRAEAVRMAGVAGLGVRRDQGVRLPNRSQWAT